MRTPGAIIAGLATLGLGLTALTAPASALPGEPAVVGESTSAVTQSSAILNAKLDTGGAETSYHFEYGTTAAYGASVPAPDADAGAEGTVSVGQQITGLQPGVTYHYRVVAANVAGRVPGGDQTFTTPTPQPPIVDTEQASGVAQGGATLAGTVETQGFETLYEFDLGVDTSYGTRIFGDAGAGPGAQTFTFPLQGLTPGTTYHYRIAATNTFGTSYGIDQTFTTASYPTATLAPPPTSVLVPTRLIAPSTAGGLAKAGGAKTAAHTSKRHAQGRRGATSATRRYRRRPSNADGAAGANRRDKR